MLLHVADFYIKRVYDEIEFQQTINDAAIAWNIACFDIEERENIIKKYRKELKKLNPHFTKRDINNEEKMIRRIIKQKDEHYPKENAAIVEVFTENLPDGKYKVNAISMDKKYLKSNN